MELGGKQFSKKELVIAGRQLIFWLVFSVLQRLLPVKVFFPFSGNNVAKKSFIPVSGNGF